MRVIGGSSRGRALEAPPVAESRPTSSRVREAIFDILGSRGGVEGLSVVDLFAGSGALGIEALSRGAAAATFVEIDRRAVRSIEHNIAAVDLPEASTVVVRSDALDFCRGSSQQFDLAFCDPPYAFDDWQTLLRLVRADRLVLESSLPPALPETLEALRQYRYGGTLVTLVEARRAGAKGHA